MIVDTSAASECLELICFSIYACIESILISLGIQQGATIADTISHEKVDCQNKTERIEICLGTSSPVDLWELRELALSEGGLLRGEFDQRVEY